MKFLIHDRVFAELTQNQYFRKQILAVTEKFNILR